MNNKKQNLFFTSLIQILIISSFFHIIPISILAQTNHKILEMPDETPQGIKDLVNNYKNLLDEEDKVQRYVFLSRSLIHSEFGRSDVDYALAEMRIKAGRALVGVMLKRNKIVKVLKKQNEIYSSEISPNLKDKIKTIISLKRKIYNLETEIKRLNDPRLKKLFKDDLSGKTIEELQTEKDKAEKELDATIELLEKAQGQSSDLTIAIWFEYYLNYSVGELIPDDIVNQIEIVMNISKELEVLSGKIKDGKGDITDLQKNERKLLNSFIKEREILDKQISEHKKQDDFYWLEEPIISYEQTKKLEYYEIEDKIKKLPIEAQNKIASLKKIESELQKHNTKHSEVYSKRWDYNADVRKNNENKSLEREKKINDRIEEFEKQEKEIKDRYYDTSIALDKIIKERPKWIETYITYGKYDSKKDFSQYTLEQLQEVYTNWNTPFLKVQEDSNKIPITKIEPFSIEGYNCTDIAVMKWGNESGEAGGVDMIVMGDKNEVLHTLIPDSLIVHNDKIYIANSQNGTIEIYNTSGKHLSSFSPDFNPSELSIDTDGNLYTLDLKKYNSTEITRYHNNGEKDKTFILPVTIKAKDNHPIILGITNNKLILNGDKYIWEVDINNGEIINKIDRNENSYSMLFKYSDKKIYFIKSEIENDKCNDLYKCIVKDSEEKTLFNFEFKALNSYLYPMYIDNDNNYFILQKDINLFKGIKHVVLKYNNKGSLLKKYSLDIEYEGIVTGVTNEKFIDVDNKGNIFQMVTKKDGVHILKWEPTK